LRFVKNPGNGRFLGILTNFLWGNEFVVLHHQVSASGACDVCSICEQQFALGQEEALCRPVNSEIATIGDESPYRMMQPNNAGSVDIEVAIMCRNERIGLHSVPKLGRGKNTARY
jgi:hypothetical protein